VPLRTSRGSRPPAPSGDSLVPALLSKVLLDAKDCLMIERRRRPFYGFKVIREKGMMVKGAENKCAIRSLSDASPASVPYGHGRARAWTGITFSSATTPSTARSSPECAS